MKFPRYLAVALLAFLCACSSSHRPVYTGHEESTEGVPGFVNGKKTSPYVKLGQGYSVDGEDYVPRNQPDYVEEGNASWYGPGFHGGKTANGEVFDSNELTGAHRTLPLPSIVRVTMLSTGKQVYIRINDRGPFAHSRILDMSRAAADKIGLLRAGVAKVRVEYMPKESERFAALLAQGRDPKSIDLASEVLDYNSGNSDVHANVASPAEDSHAGSFWDDSKANAEPTPEAAIESLKTPPSTETNSAAPVSDVVSSDLAAPASPFAAMDSRPPAPVQHTAVYTPQPSAVSQPIAAAGGIYVQLGAFANQGNAERLVTKYKDIAPLRVVTKSNTAGQELFHVRAGPYAADTGMDVRDKLVAAGADAHLIKE